MREKWGVTYFKLDANFWGAMHGGKLHNPKATPSGVKEFDMPASPHRVWEAIQNAKA